MGFHADYKLNQNKIDKALAQILSKHPVERIIVTGHSLGAALASINGLYLAMSDLEVPVEVHQFGSPRVGN